MNIAVCTTFPNSAWGQYAGQALRSFVKYWPSDVSLMIQLDDAALKDTAEGTLRNEDAIATEHPIYLAEFLSKNQGRDDPQDYRKQACRFSHKVAVIKRSMDAIMMTPEAERPDWLFWIDADVVTVKQVTDEWLSSFTLYADDLLYLGRKDWPHSECGFIGFRCTGECQAFIDAWWEFYANGTVFDQQQWDDSWLFDLTIARTNIARTNLSAEANGNNVFQQTVLGECLEHWKGPLAKQYKRALTDKEMQQPMIPQVFDKRMMIGDGRQPLAIQTVNSMDTKFIHDQITENAELITEWLDICKPHHETAVVCSGGPSLDVSLVKQDYDKGMKIVAVKHAVTRLVKAGIKPWAVILLDPRDHVAAFLDDIPPGTIVFVASQVDPAVTKRLLSSGHRIIGYHAPVGFIHEAFNDKIIVNGGSATATRGLPLLHALGFRSFRLYGYDLCYFQKPDMSLVNEHGSPRNLEIHYNAAFPFYSETRTWFTEGQFAAQIQEFHQFLESQDWEVNAFGEGVVPWLVKCKKLSDLKAKELQSTMKPHREPSLPEFLGENKWKVLSFKIRGKMQKRKTKR